MFATQLLVAAFEILENQFQGEFELTAALFRKILTEIFVIYQKLRGIGNDVLKINVRIRN